MDKEEQKFIYKYCKRYGVKMEKGPGAPKLNGVEITGDVLKSLFSINDDLVDN